MKKCNVCFLPKELSQYHNSKAEVGGKCHTCKECAITRAKKWAKQNKQRANAKSREWGQRNVVKRKTSRMKWKETNPDMWQAIKRNNESRRRAVTKAAAPKWLTPAHRAEIIETYKTALDLQWLSEEKLHVDHIVPLRGANFCGLHVPWNLQILPSGENIRKRNNLEKT